MSRKFGGLVQLGLYSVAALSLVTIALDDARADWTPTKELVIITHVKSTSSTYLFARAYADALAKVVPTGAKVESVRGARGDRARREIRIKNADNPYMMQVITPSQVNNPILAEQKSRPWMFTPIALVVVSPNLFAVNAESPYRTMKDVMDKACANPGKVIHGGGDFGNVASLNSILLQRKIGCKITYTPFQSQGITELLGGHIDFVTENPAQLLQYVEAGKVRILAASEKLGQYPNVPTYEQAGYGFPVLKQYRGLWMGKDVDPEAVKYWISIVDKVVSQPSFQEYVKKNNLTQLDVKGKAVGDVLKQDYENYLKLDTELNLIGKKKKK
jgi:putative tricarboxylic transport membrane protein